MANNIPFQAMGKTVVLSCTTSSSNAAITADSPSNQYMIVNTGTNDVFMVTGTDNTATAVRPTVGTPQYGFCVGANSTKVISNGQSSATKTIYMAGVSNAGTSLIYITPGEGF
jgi:hypothetical protein